MIRLKLRGALKALVGGTIILPAKLVAPDQKEIEAIRRRNLGRDFSFFLGRVPITFELEVISAAIVKRATRSRRTSCVRSMMEARACLAPPALARETPRPRPRERAEVRRSRS